LILFIFKIKRYYFDSKKLPIQHIQCRIYASAFLDEFTLHVIDFEFLPILPVVISLLLVLGLNIIILVLRSNIILLVILMGFLRFLPWGFLC
jgi:hypothetical protein